MQSKVCRPFLILFCLVCVLLLLDMIRDPSSSVEFSDVLYRDKAFVSSLAHALEDTHGVMVVQVGEVQYFSDVDPMPFHGAYTSTDKTPYLTTFGTILQQHGEMVAMNTYSESHGQFMGPWEFRILHKMADTARQYYASPARIDWTLARNAQSSPSAHLSTDTSSSSSSLFQYFDGATWAAAQYPSTVDATVFCGPTYPAQGDGQQPPQPLYCQEQVRGYDPHESARLVQEHASSLAGKLHVLPDTVQLLETEMAHSPASSVLPPVLQHLGSNNETTPLLPAWPDHASSTTADSSSSSWNPSGLLFFDPFGDRTHWTR